MPSSFKNDLSGVRPESTQMGACSRAMRAAARRAPRRAMHALLAGTTWLDVNLNHALHLKNVTCVESGAMHRMVHVPANRPFGLTVNPFQQACQ